MPCKTRQEKRAGIAQPQPIKSGTSDVNRYDRDEFRWVYSLMRDLRAWFGSNVDLRGSWVIGERALPRRKLFSHLHANPKRKDAFYPAGKGTVVSVCDMMIHYTRGCSIIFKKWTNSSSIWASTFYCTFLTHYSINKLVQWPQHTKRQILYWLIPRTHTKTVKLKRMIQATYFWICFRSYVWPSLATTGSSMISWLRHPKQKAKSKQKPN